MITRDTLYLNHVPGPGTRQVVSSNPRVVPDARGEVINSLQVMSVVILQYTKLIVNNGQSALHRPITAVHLQCLLVVRQSKVQFIEPEETI